SLSTFTYNASGNNFRLAGNTGSGSGERSNGTLTLANTSTITANAMVIGGGSNSNGGTATLNLGAGLTTINANTINIGLDKASGTVRWLPATVTGNLKIRGTGGTDTDRANITLASRGQSGSGTAADSATFTGHSVDIMANTLIIGRSTNSSTESGTLSFD